MKMVLIKIRKTADDGYNDTMMELFLDNSKG